MKTKRTRIVAGTIIFIIAGWSVVSLFRPPPFPKAEEYLSEPLEVRVYRPFAAPLGGTSCRAIYDQISWHLTKPGQVRVVDASHAPGVVDLKSALEELGYAFPEGTSIESDCFTPGWQFRHHPSVLNHIERYLGLERWASGVRE